MIETIRAVVARFMIGLHPSARYPPVERADHIAGAAAATIDLIVGTNADERRLFLVPGAGHCRKRHQRNGEHAASTASGTTNTGAKPPPGVRKFVVWPA